MKISQYNKTKHKSDLVDLLKSRDMNPNNADSVPKYGVIVHNSDLTQTIAAGFMRMVEGQMGILDSYITNPDANSEDRNNALDLITFTLINSAKASKLNKLITITQNDGIYDRAKEHGFVIEQKSSILLIPASKYVSYNSQELN